MTTIFIDADACPVKEETYKVAKRYQLPVIVVANVKLQVPVNDWLHMVVVPGNLDAADDWIATHSKPDDIVITSDIPLAARCLEHDSVVIDSRGSVFTEDRIGEALASREIMSQLRDQGVVTGGPAPFSKQHRSNFLQRLDQEIQAIKKRNKTNQSTKGS